MAGLWLMSHPNDPSKMVQTVFQPTRKKSAGVGSFWWKHLGGLLYDFLVICGCAIFIAGFCRVGSVWVGSFLFQWKHGLMVCCYVFRLQSGLSISSGLYCFEIFWGIFCIFFLISKSRKLSSFTVGKHLRQERVNETLLTIKAFAVLKKNCCKHCFC